MAATRHVGYEVVQAEDGLALLDRYQAHRDHLRLLIADLICRDVAGSIACDNCGAGARLPTILITGTDSRDLSDQLDMETLLLRKPFQMVRWRDWFTVCFIKRLASMIRPISIVLVDDHALVRDMLRQRLAQETDMVVLVCESNAQDAVRCCVATRPDVVLLDIDITGAVGVRGRAVDQESMLRDAPDFFSCVFSRSLYRSGPGLGSDGLSHQNEPPRWSFKPSVR